MNNPEKPKTMKLNRTLLAALVAAVLIPGGLWARGKTGNARIKVDIERQKGEIDRNIYGNFVEHLGSLHHRRAPDCVQRAGLYTAYNVVGSRVHARVQKVHAAGSLGVRSVFPEL